MFTKWETLGICGLVDNSGRGRPSLLSDKQKSVVTNHVKKSPRSLKTVLSNLEIELGFTISIDTLKNICKQAGLVWKRVRKSLRTKRNQDDFDASKDKLKLLIQQHKDNEINLCYFDESGFTLEPCVPYAWHTSEKPSKYPAQKVSDLMF